MAGASTHVAINDDFFCHMPSLPKNVSKCLIIIPDENRLSYPHNGGTEIAGRPEHQPRQDIVCRRGRLQIYHCHFLAFGRNETARRTRHG